MTDTAPTKIIRHRRGAAASEVDDVVAVEEPLEIRVEGHSLAVVMRTPGHDRELAAGFLLTEGIIKTARDLFDLATCVDGGEGGAIDAALAHPGSFDASKLTRHVFTSSSCGVCSKATIEAVLKRRHPLEDKFTVPARILRALPARLAKRQSAFQATGGLHACAIFDTEGTLVTVREDVGRHNALDKLAGWALLEKLTPLRGCGVLLSGRASFEMMQKAHAAGIALVAAIGAPSSLAVDFAREAGQTLVGFLRIGSLNVYAGEQRIG